MRFRQSILLSIMILCCAFSCNAADGQSGTDGYRLNFADSSRQAKKKDSFNSQTDLIDILSHALPKSFIHKADLNRKNQQKNPYISILPAAGYVLSTGLTATLSANVSFYTGNTEKNNISAISSSFNYSQYHQILIPVYSNIWINENDWDFVGDWRYYKYPTYTYGLGSRTALKDADLINYNYLRVYQYALKEILPNFLAGFGYNLDYHWNIREVHPSDAPSDFALYNAGATSTVSSGAAVNFLYDTRKNSNNPRPGSYFNLIYRSNSIFLGSNSGWQSVYFDARKYVHFPANSDNILAFWNIDWFVLGGQPPYFDLPSTGWDSYSNSGRGYIQGRFRGDRMIYLESEYRFKILNNGFVGGVVFVNSQAVSDYPGNNFDKVYPGFGTGLRIKFNKYSNTNLCVDYGFGVDGSRGFAVNLGEVF